MLINKLLRRFMDEAGGAEDGGAAGGAPAVAAEPADASTEADVNWAGMADSLLADDAGEDDDGVVEGDAEVVEAPAVASEATPPAAPVAETPPVETPAVPPTPTPPTAETPATPPTPATPAPDYTAWRTERLGQLEQQYALNEADATAMLTEPETVLPRLAAQVHMEVLESAMQGMQAMMPVLMQQLNQHTELNNRAKNLFTSINPDLADPQFEPAILQLGQVYRNVNARATPEEAARAIGNLVRSALGIAAPAVAAPSPAAPTPAAPVPFTPARGGGSGNAPIPSSNAFTQLANEFLLDDN